MRAEIREPDGTVYALTADRDQIRLTRSTPWSSTTWSLDAVCSRALADALHDVADEAEA